MREIYRLDADAGARTRLSPGALRHRGRFGCRLLFFLKEFPERRPGWSKAFEVPPPISSSVPGGFRRRADKPERRGVITLPAFRWKQRQRPFAKEEASN